VYAVGKGTLPLPGCFYGEAGLADAPGAREREQPDLVQEALYLRQLPLSSQQGRRESREAGLGVCCRCGGGGGGGGEGGGGASSRYGCQEGGVFIFGEPQGARQGANGVSVGSLPLTALQHADPLAREAGPLGELLLREPPRLTQSPEARPERNVSPGNNASKFALRHAVSIATLPLSENAGAVLLKGTLRAFPKRSHGVDGSSRS